MWFAGIAVPSRAFNEGGIHEAHMAYEDTVFYEILAEELAGGIWNWKVSLRRRPRAW